MSPRRNLVARGRPGATHVGWSRPDADDGPRQVSWLAAWKATLPPSAPRHPLRMWASPPTVAGTAPAFVRLPFSPTLASAAPLATSGLGARAEACQFRPSRLWAADLFEAGRNQPKSQEIQDEDRRPSRLSHDQGADDRRHRVRDPLHLGQGR